MQSFKYFLKTYGNAQGRTVMHRMRTWYSQQAKLAERERRQHDADRFNWMAEQMSIRIEIAG